MTLGPWPRRPRLVAGNWKMHKTGAEGAALARELRSLLPAPACEVVVCPPVKTRQKAANTTSFA